MSESSGDKTEEPTPKRLKEARKKGQVAKSADLTGGLVFVVIFVTLAMAAESWFTELLVYMRLIFSIASTGIPLQDSYAPALAAFMDTMRTPLLAGFGTAIAIGMLQTGGLFSLDVLQPDLKKVMPDPKKVVSAAAFVEMAKGFVKIFLAAAVAWVSVEPLIRSLGNLTGKSPQAVLMLLGYAANQIGLKMVLVVTVIGVADYMWQRHKTHKELMMTHEEVKREFKESEGDPQHKAERKQLHKELSEQRMLSDVRKADFVVVNPDHIAVAIRYERGGTTAPQVVAKGEHLLAEKIKEVAREAGVPIFRDVSLARALRDVQEGDEIPEALYEAVAAILRVVYGVGERGGQPAGGGGGGGGGQQPGAAGGGPAAPPAAPPGPGAWRRA